MSEFPWEGIAAVVAALAYLGLVVLKARHGQPVTKVEFERRLRREREETMKEVRQLLHDLGLT